MVTALLISLMVLAADPAPEPAPGAEPPAGPAAAEMRAAKPDETRLVCRRDTKPNTRFKSKVCKTAAEWEARAEAARQAFAEEQQRPMINIGKGD